MVLNWNKAARTAACVAALARQTRHLTVVVVDNGSDGAALGELGRCCVVLRNERNLGFTGGVNAGIRRALADGAKFVWLLNNDAEAAPDALERMLAAVAADPRIGLASPLIRNGDAGDAIEFCGGLRQGNDFLTTADPITYARWSDTAPDRIWLVGTALLVRRRLIEAIGLFDERFFAYWEDNDYSVRSHAAGFRNVVVPDAVVRHWSGNPLADAGSKPVHYYYYMARNEMLFLRKHLGLGEIGRPLLWAIDRQFRLLGRLRAYPAAADAVLAGLWDGFRGRGGAYDPGRRLSPAVLRMLRGIRWGAGYRV